MVRQLGKEWCAEPSAATAHGGVRGSGALGSRNGVGGRCGGGNGAARRRSTARTWLGVRRGAPRVRATWPIGLTARRRSSPALQMRPRHHRALGRRRLGPPELGPAGSASRSCAAAAGEPAGQTRPLLHRARRQAALDARVPAVPGRAADVGRRRRLLPHVRLGRRPPGQRNCDLRRRGVRRRAPPGCLQPPLAKVPEGDWLCPECVASGNRAASKPSRPAPPPSTSAATASPRRRRRRRLRRWTTWRLRGARLRRGAEVGGGGSFVCETCGKKMHSAWWGAKMEGAPPIADADAAAAAAASRGGGGAAAAAVLNVVSPSRRRESSSRRARRSSSRPRRRWAAAAAAAAGGDAAAAAAAVRAAGRQMQAASGASPPGRKKKKGKASRSPGSRRRPSARRRRPRRRRRRGGGGARGGAQGAARRARPAPGADAPQQERGLVGRRRRWGGAKRDPAARGLLHQRAGVEAEPRRQVSGGRGGWCKPVTRVAVTWSRCRGHGTRSRATAATELAGDRSHALALARFSLRSPSLRRCGAAATCVPAAAGGSRRRAGADLARRSGAARIRIYRAARSVAVAARPPPRAQPARAPLLDEGREDHRRPALRSLHSHDVGAVASSAHLAEERNGELCARTRSRAGACAPPRRRPRTATTSPPAPGLPLSRGARARRCSPRATAWPTGCTS